MYPLSLADVDKRSFLIVSRRGVKCCGDISGAMPWVVDAAIADRLCDASKRHSSHARICAAAPADIDGADRDVTFNATLLRALAESRAGRFSAARLRAIAQAGARPRLENTTARIIIAVAGSQTRAARRNHPATRQQIVRRSSRAIFIGRPCAMVGDPEPALGTNVLPRSTPRLL